MSVYVGQTRHSFGSVCAVLIADSSREFHEMIARLPNEEEFPRIVREGTWLELAHITLSQRSRAIELGAIEIKDTESGRKVYDRADSYKT